MNELLKNQHLEPSVREAFKGIGGRIRFLRKIFGFSQKDFADKIGLSSHMTIYQYEKSLRIPDMAKIRIIALIGNTTSKWLLTGIIDKKNCDQLIDSIKEMHRGVKKEPETPERINHLFSWVAQDLDIPKEYLQAISEHKITPSGSFIKKYCGYYRVDPLRFIDVLMSLDNMGFGEEIYSPGKKEKQPQNKKDLDDMIEINRLLMEDDEGRKLVLDVLRSRKSINSNIKKLTDKE